MLRFNGLEIDSEGNNRWYKNGEWHREGVRFEYEKWIRNRSIRR